MLKGGNVYVGTGAVACPQRIRKARRAKVEKVMPKNVKRTVNEFSLNHASQEHIRQATESPGAHDKVLQTVSESSDKKGVAQGIGDA